MGVFDKLGKHPFDYKRLRIDRLRSKAQLSIWIRPTISFNLKCSGNDKLNRASFLEITSGLPKGKLNEEKGKAHMTVILADTCLGLAILFSMFIIVCGLKKRGRWYLWIPIFLGYAVPFGLLIACIFTSK